MSKKSSNNYNTDVAIRLSGGSKGNSFTWGNKDTTITRGELTNVLYNVEGISVLNSCKNTCDYVVYSDTAEGASESAQKSAGEAEPVSFTEFLEGILSPDQRDQVIEILDLLVRTKEAKKLKKVEKKESGRRRSSSSSKKKNNNEERKRNTVPSNNKRGRKKKVTGGAGGEEEDLQEGEIIPTSFSEGEEDVEEEYKNPYMNMQTEGDENYFAPSVPEIPEPTKYEYNRIVLQQDVKNMLKRHNINLEDLRKIKRILRKY